MARSKFTNTFSVGNNVRVFEPKGCRELSKGPCSSERLGGEYPDITPEEELLVVKKIGSNQALVRRPSGQEILLHINHINGDADYYALRASPKKEENSIELLRKQLKELEELNAREEAKKLFAAAE